MPRPFEDIVLFCDNHLLVVDKPAGMPTQADISGDLDLLTDGKRYLKSRFRKPGQVFLGLVHRLDRPVSGVLVMARTSKAAARLSDQFRVRDVTKKYFAMVEGSTGPAGRETAYVRKRGGGVVLASAGEEGAQYAELGWVKIADHEGSSILEVDLLTGRKHQIRFQLSAMGHPIVGDRRYGAKTPFVDRNIALHCFALSLDHPTRGTRLTWRSLPPKSWVGVRDALRRRVEQRSR